VALSFGIEVENAANVLDNAMAVGSVDCPRSTPTTQLVERRRKQSRRRRVLIAVLVHNGGNTSGEKAASMMPSGKTASSGSEIPVHIPR
jgi:hypothetical protein